MRRLVKKLRKIWAVLKWDDAVVWRQSALSIRVSFGLPVVTGTQLGMTCAHCYARWTGDGEPID